MHETLHINQRARQRGITKRMIELTLEFGEVQADKIRLGTRRIKNCSKTVSRSAWNLNAIFSRSSTRAGWSWSLRKKL